MGWVETGHGRKRDFLFGKTGRISPNFIFHLPCLLCGLGGWQQEVFLCRHLSARPLGASLWFSKWVPR